MYRHPLVPPDRDSPLLADFLRIHQIDAKKPPVELLGEVARAFSRLPFENLTKIIKDAEADRVESARRWPTEVFADYRQHGAGGTCFALTATLLHLVRALGFAAEPILADRRYGADTHSALLVWLDGEPHLLDPGYLIVRPLPIPTSGPIHVPTPFNELILTPKGGGAKVDLQTRQDNQSTYRLTFKTTPVDAGEFLRAWDVSFDADMMRYPVLSRVVGDQQVYFQKRHLLVRGKGEAQRAEVSPNRLIAQIAQRFSIAPAIVARALEILEKK
jgi:arylamine N-acetyltransferase